MGLFDAILSRDTVQDTGLFSSASQYRNERAAGPSSESKRATKDRKDSASVANKVAKPTSKKRKHQDTTLEVPEFASKTADIGREEGKSVRSTKKDKKTKKREKKGSTEDNDNADSGGVKAVSAPTPGEADTKPAKKQKRNKLEGSAVQDEVILVQQSDTPAVAQQPKKKKRKSTQKDAPPPTSGEDGEAHEHETIAKAQSMSTGDPAPNTEDAGTQESKKVARTAEEEAEILARTIFVGNLPADMKRKQLQRIFLGYGEIESVRFRSVPVKLDKMLPRRAAVLSNHVSTDRGSAHAYIVFKEAPSAQAALAHNMKEVDGRHVRVDKASQPRREGSFEAGGPTYDRSCSVFVGNLPFDVEDEEVISLFNDETGEASSVEAVRIVRDKETNLGKGIAFVLFADKNQARMALAKDGALLRKRPVRVTRVAAVGQAALAGGKKAQIVSSLGRVQATGALGRLQRKQKLEVGKAATTPVASWQGTQTKGKGKIKHSTSAQPTKARKESSQSKDRAVSKKAGEGSLRKTKRPAVVARKAKALGVPAPKGIAKKSKGAKKSKSR